MLLLRVKKGDVLSLGLKSKKEVADAMAVSLLEPQKVRFCVCVCGYLRYASKSRHGVIASTVQERVVIRRCCRPPRRTPVAMRGALGLATRIMSCEKLPNAPLQRPNQACTSAVFGFWAKSVLPGLRKPLPRFAIRSLPASRCRGDGGRTAVRLRISSDVIRSLERRRCWIGRRCAALGPQDGLLRVCRLRPRLLSCEVDWNVSQSMGVSNRIGNHSEGSCCPWVSQELHVSCLFCRPLRSTSFLAVRTMLLPSLCVYHRPTRHM